MAAEIRSAVLLAAGRGTRLGELVAKTPKPMLEVGGAPLISHIIDALAAAGITRFVIVVGYLGEQIERWSRECASARGGIEILCVTQPKLDGTGGAMLAARERLGGESRFIFGWGDILMDVANYPRFVERARRDDFDLLLAVNRVKDPFKGAAVYLSATMNVTRLDEKPAEGTATTEWNNAGLFASGPVLFEYLDKLKISPRGEYELPAAIAAMIASGRIVRAIDIRGFWSDVGSPLDLEIARRHFKPHRNGK